MHQFVPGDQILLPSRSLGRVRILARLAQTNKHLAKIGWRPRALYGLLHVQQRLMTQVINESCGRFTISICLYPRTHSLVVKSRSSYSFAGSILTIKPCRDGFRTMQFEERGTKFGNRLTWSTCLDPKFMVSTFDSTTGVLFYYPWRTQCYQRIGAPSMQLRSFSHVTGHQTHICEEKWFDARSNRLVLTAYHHANPYRDAHTEMTAWRRFEIEGARKPS